jgi:hypothetical protein
MRKKIKHYDSIVIGSSPIGVMLAIKLSKNGEKVGLIESSSNVGGAWKKEYFEGIGETECACHLIEFQANAYRILEEVFEIEFCPMNPQPIKIYPNGKREKYTTRTKIISDFARQCALILALIIIRILKIKLGRNLKLPELYSNACFIFKYRVLYLLKFKGIEAPKGGYEAFASKIHEQIVKNKVNIEKGKANSLSISSNGKYIIKNDNDIILSAKKIYLSESIILEYYPKFLPYRNKLKNPYWHVIVSVNSSEIKIKQQYIHLPNDAKFHRITSLKPTVNNKETNERKYFLVQTRSEIDNIDTIVKEIENLFEKCGIKKKGVEVRGHEIIVDKYFSNEDEAQLIPGIYNNSLHVIKTVGDLARCMILNEKILTSSKR